VKYILLLKFLRSSGCQDLSLNGGQHKYKTHPTLFYPYGLTQTQVNVLKNNRIEKIRELAETSDKQLRSLSGIGEKSVNHIRNMLGQVIWM